jgi:hypothetical protein
MSAGVGRIAVLWTPDVPGRHTRSWWRSPIVTPNYLHCMCTVNGWRHRKGGMSFGSMTFWRIALSLVNITIRWDSSFHTKTCSSYTSVWCRLYWMDDWQNTSRDHAQNPSRGYWRFTWHHQNVFFFTHRLCGKGPIEIPLKVHWRFHVA